MSILSPRIASRLFGEPLMVDAGKLAAILSGIGGRVVDGGIVLPGVNPVDHVAFAAGRPSDAMGVVGNRLDRLIAQSETQSEGRVFDRVGNVAIVPVEGTLVQKGKWLGSYSGDTSYEGTRAIVASVSRAADAGAIKGAVFEIDSYGGQVSGAFETAAAMAQLSAKIPTLAILTDFAFSAGYLLASTARQIVMPPGGGAGSIGVIAMHADFSKQLEQDGIAVTLITAGAHKADGSPVRPLDNEVRGEIQSRVNASYERFLAAVGTHRGARLDREAARATEARTYVGEAAVAAGLVDGIAEVDQAFAEFVNRVS
jgi:signal peptide peptidase SppA